MALVDELTDAEDEPQERNPLRGGVPFLDRLNDALIRRGIAPMDIANQDTKAKVKLRLRLIAKAIIKNEIQTDPMGRGYNGKTDAQIADLLNTAFTVVRMVPDGLGGNVAVNDAYPPRLCTILAGIPYAPNRIPPGIIAEIMT